MPTFATFTPQAAARIEAPVEIFTVLAPSPTVPTISTASSNPSTFRQCFIIALANPTTYSSITMITIKFQHSSED